MNENEISEERIQKTVVFCVQMLNELVEDGILEGGAYSVSEQGEKEIEDFKPTEREIEIAMAILAKDGAFG